MITGVYESNGKTYEFRYTASPTMYEKLFFVKTVVEGLFIEGHYFSNLRNMLFDFYIIRCFTDFDADYISTSDNMVNEIESLLNSVNIVDIVTEAMGYHIIDELNQAIDKDIEFKTGIRKDLISESLSSLINTLEEKIEAIDVDSMMEVGKALSGISGDVTIDKVLESYSSSDVFKKQFEKITQERERHEAIVDELKDGLRIEK